MLVRPTERPAQTPRTQAPPQKPGAKIPDPRIPAPEISALGSVTHSEILQQPPLWLDTVRRIGLLGKHEAKQPRRPFFIGAGSSAYAASAIAMAWPGAQAVASTDLLLAADLCGPDRDAVITIARSGNSPENLGAVRRIQQLYPHLRQFALTCNPQGEVNSIAGVQPILLDPRTNDRALAMTSSFSSLILAGLALRHEDEMTRATEEICSRAGEIIPALEARARDIAQTVHDRTVILASAPLSSVARETALKITELTGGAIAALAESFLGLRHGPMSFLRKETLVVCLLSSEAHRRRYELDLIAELRSKQLGRLAVIGPESWSSAEVEHVPAMASDLPDALRSPFEIVFPQLLAFHLSLRAGLDPDEPSPGGVIHRVVRGVHLYEP